MASDLSAAERRLRGERIRVTADIQVPAVPNYLHYGPGSMRVGDVSDDDLRRIGQAWTERLIRRAHQQREEQAHD